MFAPLTANPAGLSRRFGLIGAGIGHSMKRALRYLCRLAKDMSDVVRGKL
jgi:hypothetical protein